MSSYLFAKRYAKSLIEVAQEFERLDIIERDMRLLKNLCEQSHDFLFLLKNPLIPRSEKSRGIVAVCNTKIDELTMKFLQLLMMHHRENWLLQIVAAFYKQYYVIKQVQQVKLTTAVPISEKVKNRFIEKIKNETMLKTVEMTCYVKEELIGGFVLEFSDKIVDASLQRGLKELRNKFEKAHVAASLNLLADESGHF